MGHQSVCVAPVAPHVLGTQTWSTPTFDQPSDRETRHSRRITTQSPVPKTSWPPSQRVALTTRNAIEARQILIIIGSHEVIQILRICIRNRKGWAPLDSNHRRQAMKPYIYKYSLPC